MSEQRFVSPQPQPKAEVEPGRESPRLRLAPRAHRRTGPQERPARVVVATMSAGAALIHLAYTHQQMAVSALFGLAFVTFVLVQVAFAVLALARPRPWTLLGTLANAAIAGTWVLSRTVGLPVGPVKGPLPIGFADTVATSLEILTVILALGLARGWGAQLRRSHAIVIAVVVAGLSVLGALSATGAVHFLVPSV